MVSSSASWRCAVRSRERHPRKAAVAKQIALEAERGQPRSDRQGTRAVVRVRRPQFEVEQRAVIVADGEHLHSFDQLAAIHAPRPRRRGGAQGTAVGHHRRGQDLVVAGQAPVAGHTLAQAPPQPKPRPAGEGAVQSGERNTRQPIGDAPCMPPKVRVQISPLRRRRKVRSGLRPRGAHRPAPAPWHPTPLRPRRRDLDVSQASHLSSRRSGRTPGRRQIRRAQGACARHWQREPAPSSCLRNVITRRSVS